MEILMTEEIIARRTLRFTSKDGDYNLFDITISAPFETDDGEYCCLINSQDLLFKRQRRVFGVDAIDAIDYAIQSIDNEIFYFNRGDISWPDGSTYNRIESKKKFEWGK